VSVSPRAADAIRKVVGYALAAGITLLLFRVLGRVAEGRQRLADGELIALVVLVALALLWVRAAKRVRAGSTPPPTDSTPRDSGS
jgi:membrane protein DedA with SNARE-associated domain